MKTQALMLLLAASLLVTSAFSATAQDQQAAEAAGGAPQQAWATQCAAPSRSAPLNCTMDQRVIVRETGRPIARISIQVAGEERKPALLLHVPLSLSIGAGISMQVDDAEPLKLPVQTCDVNGCYAGSPLSAEMVAALKRGKSLKLGFQGLDQKPVSIPFSLAGFTASYEQVE